MPTGFYFWGAVLVGFGALLFIASELARRHIDRMEEEKRRKQQGELTEEEYAPPHIRR
jgi:hypothetical protein